MKNKIVNLIALTALGLGLMSSAALSAENTPVGKWQTSSGESRYVISECSDGKAICAKLVWLRADARSPENLKYLNKTVMAGALPVRENSWRGAISYAGEKLNGNLTLVNSDRLRLNGCSFVFCQTISLNRI